MTTAITRREAIRLGAGAGIAAVFAPLLHSTSAGAQAGDTQLVCNANGVNVRSDPSLSGDVIHQMYVGDVVNLIGDPVDADGYTWLNITGYANDIPNGWAASDFLEAPNNEGWPVGTHVYVAVESLNMRDYPGLSGGVIRTLSRNTHAITSRTAVARDGYTWYQVVLDDGTEGYLAGDYLSTESSGDNGGDNGSGWAPGTTVRVTANNLRLRGGPGTGYEIVAVYSTGTTAEILDGPSSGGGYRWYQVTVLGSGVTGWFAEDFLEVGGTAPGGSRLRVVNGPLRLRTGGGLDYDTITTIPTGGVVVIADDETVSADGYTWTYVYLESDPDVAGWIASGFTEAIS